MSPLWDDPPRLGRKEPVCLGRQRTRALNERQRGSEVTVHGGNARSSIRSSARIRLAVREDVFPAPASSPSPAPATEPFNAFDSNGRDEAAALLLDGG